MGNINSHRGKTKSLVTIYYSDKEKEYSSGFTYTDKQLNELNQGKMFIVPIRIR